MVEQTRDMTEIDVLRYPVKNRTLLRKTLGVQNAFGTLRAWSGQWSAPEKCTGRKDSFKNMENMEKQYGRPVFLELFEFYANPSFQKRQHQKNRAVIQDIDTQQVPDPVKKDFLVLIFQFSPQSCYGGDRSRDKAEVFNVFFASVFNMDSEPRETQCLMLKDHKLENDQPPVDPEIVQDLLLQLDPYKSMGPDKICPRILKKLTDVITEPLSMIFEQSWKSREVPADWKLANVVTVLKKGKKENP
ncbi:hypothetical protein WISP_144447 [Willisornis vidua]|uniref:Rna-directed dna polymerase from mobile element jockey-like n=1 Tax=Willisornis vidua TaxID=1566151 RepID=A0ABQ9CNU0_9PASS|nr:hypothetical protein WISP_144447 [Willisornis vidua]